MLKAITIITAIAFIIIGAITFPMPIPIGLILFSTGIAMLIGVSKVTKIIIKKMRKRYQTLDVWLYKAQQVAPGFIGRRLISTDPRAKRRFNKEPND